MANALESLRSNRLRTCLTVLGVTVGIASITVILSLSAGAATIIARQIDDVGGTLAVVRPSSPHSDVQVGNLTATLAGSGATSSLTDADVDDIREIGHAQSVAPLMILGGGVSSNDKSPNDAIIVATAPELPAITSLPLSDGQFIGSTTNTNTAVVGNQLSIDLFGTTTSVGRTFRTHGTTFTVIGILKPLDKPINYDNIDFDHAAIIGMESGRSFNQGIATIQQIDIKASSPDKLAEVISETRKILDRNHKGERDYTILSGDELARPTNELFYAVAATLSTIAAVSLLVGGIGIMNIMLVGVTERTREIGIRKALGASNAHITWQFLIEALVMSIAGGVLGYLGGYLVAFAIARTFLTFNPAFTWPIAGIAAAVALGVGVLFGLYPAIRASRKDPIEALRQYH